MDDIQDLHRVVAQPEFCAFCGEASLRDVAGAGVLLSRKGPIQGQGGSGGLPGRWGTLLLPSKGGRCVGTAGAEVVGTFGDQRS